MNSNRDCKYSHRKVANIRPQAMEGKQLCKGCVTGLIRDIQMIPGLYRDMEDAAISNGGSPMFGERIGGTKERGVRYNPAALRWLDQIRLDMWMLIKDEYPHDMYIDDMARVLARRVPDLAALEIAPHIRLTFRTMVSRAMDVSQPTVKRRVMGVCPDPVCGGEVVATIGGMRGSRLKCDGCGLDIPKREWTNWGVKSGVTKQ